MINTYPRITINFSRFPDYFSIYLKTGPLTFIKGGTIWMSRGLIGGSKGSEKSSLSFTFSAILALCILRSGWQSGWQFEWVRCRTALALKFWGNCELFYNWVVFLNGHCLSLGNHCYSVLGLRQQLAAPDPPFSNTTLTRRFRSEMDSGSTQPIFKI